jgi:hypothetical protein
MTLPITGNLSMAQIANGAELSTRAPVSLGSQAIRNVARSFVHGTRISYADLQGKSKFTFTNGNFVDGVVNSTVSQVPGWLIGLEQIKMNGLSTIDGFATPATDDAPAYPGYTNYKYEATYETDLPPGECAPTQSLKLVDLGITNAVGAVHGPYVVSESPVVLEEGDQVGFWWKAEACSDSYDIVAYLVNVNSGTTIELIDQTGERSTATTPWTKVTRVITSTEASANLQIPDYKFVFVSGSYDYVGGQWTGASLYITQILVKKWFESR